ncbi:thiolase family protein [Sporomusa malonica]|uniref:acetyl-CoA C-acyltransferase n=1 Tax=Sporomusa malonica TaxID=112901 RepID=A0A1W2E703_9FIRM|nr:thiolase family protein [Sporomusa malonica]SMD05521.1 acetyl-CoA acyltransferase [Sporomusa malonica]
MQEAVIVAAARTPLGKGYKGSLKDVRPESLGAIVVKDLLRRAPVVDPNEIEDVIMGCAFGEGAQGLNIARNLALHAGLPMSVSGMTLNRFCSAGLQAIALATEQVMLGWGDVAIGGGVESMSMVQMGGLQPAPNPELMQHSEVYIAMGQTAENVANRYGISREDQDTLALASHHKAAKAIEEGKFTDEIVPVPFVNRKYVNGRIIEEAGICKDDEGVRASATMEDLAKLKPVFHAKGSVTAGNSSQITDGAAAVMIMSAKRAEQLGLKPLAVLRSFAVGGVNPDEMGIGPVVAIPKAMKRAGLTLDKMDIILLNEAFAAQALYCMRKLDMDQTKVNPNGGAIAVGHPLGCTGAKLTVELINELGRNDGKYGLVSMCIGGGMGAAGVFEKL